MKRPRLKRPQLKRPQLSRPKLRRNRLKSGKSAPSKAAGSAKPAKPAKASRGQTSPKAATTSPEQPAAEPVVDVQGRGGVAERAEGVPERRGVGAAGDEARHRPAGRDQVVPADVPLDARAERGGVHASDRSAARGAKRARPRWTAGVDPAHGRRGHDGA